MQKRNTVNHSSRFLNTNRTERFCVGKMLLLDNSEWLDLNLTSTGLDYISINCALSSVHSF